MTKGRTVGGLILRRVVPATALALLVLLLASRFFAARVLEHQAETRIRMASALTAGQVARELDDLVDYVRALADNHMIVQALISREQRRTQLPPFFRTLRLPNSAFRSIAMFDYAGRPLASNSGTVSIDIGPHMDALSEGRTVAEVTGQSILVACPIRFRSSNNASTEGVLAAKYDTHEFLHRFRNSDQSKRLQVYQDGVLLYSDRPSENNAHDWLVADSSTQGPVELVLQQGELRATAFAALRSTDMFLVFMFLCSFAALGGTILYCSRLITNPLASMIAQIGRIEDQKGLSQRLTVNGPVEFQQLAFSFNRMLQDLSETTVSRDELQLTKDRLQLALTGGNIGLWSWDVIENTVYVSEELSAQVGEVTAFDSYDTFIARLHPDDRTETQTAVEECFSGNTPVYDVTFRLRHKDGSYRWILSRGRVTKWSEGSPTHMIGVHVDISERIEAEQQLRRTNTELERSNEELAQFAYIASHDLQEPLRKTLSFANLLREEVRGQVTEDGQMFMEHIVDAAQRMRTLIQDLLAFSRVESDGNLATVTNAAASLDDALNDLELTIESSGAKVHFDDLPFVMADQFQLTQVFSNLISNAIKYCTGEPEIRISSHAAGDRLQIKFADNGIGIDPAYRQRVFGIFKRLHGRGEYTGNGIGLAICKRIIERFDGKIWVDAGAEGRGSVFTVELLLAEEATSSRAPSEPIVVVSASELPSHLTPQHHP